MISGISMWNHSKEMVVRCSNREQYDVTVNHI